jgi:hypothetical protein
VFRARFSQFEALIHLSEIISFLDVSPMKNTKKECFTPRFSLFWALINLSGILSFLDVSPMKNAKKSVPSSF